MKNLILWMLECSCEGLFFIYRLIQQQTNFIDIKHLGWEQGIEHQVVTTLLINELSNNIMINTSCDSQSRIKLSFFQPTSEAESLTNCIELSEQQGDQLPQPSITRHLLVRKQIQLIKSKRNNSLSFRKHPEQSELLFTSAGGTSKILLNNEREEDKLGAIFSPFKEKTKKEPEKIDTSIDWEKRASKCDRDQEENAIMKKTLEVRRNFLAQGLKKALGGTIDVNSFRNRSKTAGRKKRSLHTSRICLPQNVFLLRLQRLKQLYSVLAEILMSISKNKQATIVSSEKYIKSISSLNLEFIDDFIEESEQRLQKAIRYSRIMESTGIVYLMLELLKSDAEFSTQRVNLSNLVGHTTSNIILLTRMFILQFNDPSFHKSEFEACIDRYELLEFQQNVDTVDNALTRMCHNNQIIQILSSKLGRVNQHFSKVLKDFLKKINRNREISASQHTNYLYQFLAYHLHSNKMNNSIPFLDIAPNPYLVQTSKPYTIVVEPYGVLLLVKNGKVKVRPYVFEFLSYLSHQFSVILWSWMMPQEVDPLLCHLPQAKIQKILYRYHCKQEDEIYTKNLTRLGRDMGRVLLIDYSKQVFEVTPSNGIECGWSGNKNDKKLLSLMEVIKRLSDEMMSVDSATKILNQEINQLKVVKFRSRRQSRY